MYSIFSQNRIIFLTGFSDNPNMKADGYTAKELAELLGITYDNVRKRIEKAGIKPITKNAIYPESTLEAIRNARPGRPPKAKPEAAEKPGKPE
jgi:hypothetical protein